MKYSEFTMLCYFLMVQQTDSVTYVYIYIYIYTHTHTPFHILFHYGLLQDSEYSSLRYTVGSCLFYI